MNLSTLINDLKVIQALGDIGKVDITSIAYDSRKVKSGSLFVAIKGYNVNGNDFIEQAISYGAKAVVTDDETSLVNRVHSCIANPQIFVKNARIALAELSHKFYGEPTKKLKIIGVTGTNGKTTLTYIIKKILETAGFKVGLIGTINNLIGETAIDSDKTTPESLELCEMFSAMLDEGCDYCVMEVSSHSLDLNRVHNIEFIAAIFTNLTQDHLDFHSNYENYFNAKKKLFDNLSQKAIAVSNADDKFGPGIVSDTKAKVMFYGAGDSVDFRFSDAIFDFDRMKFRITVENQDIEINTGLTAAFNLYNITAAVSLCFELGISGKLIIDGINSLNPVEGRFHVVNRDVPLKVIVDYSHTPDALENSLISIKEIVNKNPQKYNKIITVFGAGGNRDKSKRPKMAEAVEKFSDEIIITSDNPRFEEPSEIISDILKGISKVGQFHPKSQSHKERIKIIENRELAIKEAIFTANDNDIILIAGKGHEKYQDIMGKKIHFDDIEIAENYLKERYIK